MKERDTANPDNIRSGAFDPGAHAVQKIRQVNDVRFLSRGIDCRGSFCTDGGEKHINRGADGNQIENHISAGQILTLRCQDAADLLRFGTQRP